MLLVCCCSLAWVYFIHTIAVKVLALVLMLFCCWCDPLCCCLVIVAVDVLCCLRCRVVACVLVIVRVVAVLRWLCYVGALLPLRCQ